MSRDVSVDVDTLGDAIDSAVGEETILTDIDVVDIDSEGVDVVDIDVAGVDVVGIDVRDFAVLYVDIDVGDVDAEDVDVVKDQLLRGEEFSFQAGICDNRSKCLLTL